MVFDAIPINGQTWLICGGRHFNDEEMFKSAMGRLIRLRGIPRCVVQGGGTGADFFAREWGQRLAISVQTEYADWKKEGRAAGPLRNQRMIDKHKPNFVVAFPGGRGTADMIRRARVANIDVAEIIESEQAVKPSETQEAE